MILVAIALVVALVPAALAAAWFILPRIELAPYVVERATAAAGRDVAIESLRVTPGRNIAIAVRGARLANIEGGTRPEMMTLASLDLEVELWPLLRGEVIVTRANIDRLSLLLERNRQQERNWRFGPSSPVVHGDIGPDPESRRNFPIIRDLRLTGSEIIIRTRSGQALRVQLESTSLAAPDLDQPARLLAKGAYNDVPVELDTTFGTFRQFWDVPTPFPMNLRATAGGSTVLTLKGTATDPLNFDGIEAELTLEAPTPATLLALGGGSDGGPAVPLRLAGQMERQGDLWKLSSVTGSLDGAALTGPLLQMTEGSDGHADRITVQLDFTRLDLNRLLGASAGPGGRPTEDADLPLIVQEKPDPMIEARLTAADLRYRQLRATEARLQAAIVEDRIVVDELALRSFSSRFSAKGQLERRGNEVGVLAEIAMREGDLETLRRAFGLRQLPLTGRLEARVIARGQGRSLNAVVAAASLSAVVAMEHGQIQREIIEMASTDIRSLFRTAGGMTPVTCLLAVAEIRRGVGEVAPIRIQADTGTIAGIMTVDLNRRQLDLVIGSQRDTTSFFALDIPMRVNGSFADPSIRPARWSPEGRAKLAAGDTVAAVPVQLREFASRNPCYRAGANAVRPSAAPPRSNGNSSRSNRQRARTRPRNPGR